MGVWWQVGGLIAHGVWDLQATVGMKKETTHVDTEEYLISQISQVYPCWGGGG